MHRREWPKSAETRTFNRFPSCEYKIQNILYANTGIFSIYLIFIFVMAAQTRELKKPQDFITLRQISENIPIGVSLVVDFFFYPF